jgi:hypothetical protein
MGVDGGVGSGMKDVLDVVAQTAAYLNSTFTCTAQWSHGGSGEGGVKTGEAATKLYDAATAKAATDTSKLAKLKAAKKKLGIAASVAQATYGTVTDPPVWESSAKEAWTTGGDEFLQCLANAVPDYIITDKQLK